jgi:hypothetical protein
MVIIAFLTRYFRNVIPLYVPCYLLKEAIYEYK